MRSYKDVKRRIMALVVAAATILSSITISTNSKAEGCEELPSGGSIAQVFTTQEAYVKLDSVSFKLQVKDNQRIDWKVSIYRNVNTGTVPTDGILCEEINGAATATGDQTAVLTKDVYLTKDETYSAVVTFTSDMSILYYSNPATSWGYRMVPGNGWEGPDYGVMTSSTTNVQGSSTGEKFTVTLAPNKVIVDKNDVKDITLQTTLNPAYQRVIKYEVTAGQNVCTVSEGGLIHFTGNEGTATIKASVDGAHADSFTTATISVINPIKGLEPATYVFSGKECKPNVVFQDGVDAGKFTVAYENNVSAGEAYAVVKGKGDYAGYEHRVPFSITAYDLKSITQSDIDEDKIVINTQNDTIESAVITKDGTELVYNEARKDFQVRATSKTSVIVNDKLVYRYELQLDGDNKNTTGNITVTVDKEAESENDGKIDLGTLLDITLNEEIYTYTGSEIIPDFTAKLAGTVLTQEDLVKIATVSGETDANDEATLTITGIGKYKGTVTTRYVIEPRNLNTEWNENTFKLEVENDSKTKKNIYIKTGDEIKPAVKVLFYKTDRWVELKESADYKVEYADNINAGSMKVRIKGLGNYIGAHTESFPIVADFTKDVAWSVGGSRANGQFQTSYSKEYTGKEHTPRVTGTGLTADDDFIVSYEKNINAGTAKAIVEGKGNYTGQRVELTFQITKAPLPDSLVITEDTWTYTGKEISLSDTDYEIKGVDKNDYKISYDSQHTNVGTVTVVATAEDGSNYTGSVKSTFEIVPRDISVVDSDLSIVVDDGDLVYNRLPQKPKVSILYEGQEIDDKNYDIDVSNNIKPGAASLTIKGKRNLTGTYETTFQIKSRATRDVEWNVEGTGYTKTTDSEYKTAYTGVRQRPAVVLRDDDTMLKAGEDYNIAFGDNTIPGEGQITITWIGGYAGNPKTTIKFQITKRDISNVTVDVTKRLYKTNQLPEVTVTDASLSSGSIVLEEGEDKDFEVVRSSKTGDEYNLSIAGAKKIAVIKATDSSYYTGEKEVTYAIGSSIDQGEYVVRLFNPHNQEEYKELNPEESARAFFFYLGENKPTVKLYQRNGEELEEIDTSVKYESSLGDDAKIYSVYEDTQNIVTVTLKGTKEFYGTKQVQYYLLPVAIDGAETIEATSGDKAFVNGVCEIPYSGKAINAKTVEENFVMKHFFNPENKANFAVLKRDTDYTLSVTGTAVNAGDEVTVVVAGKGNYNATQTFTYRIVPKSISGCTLTQGDKTSYDYTGVPVEPRTVVMDGATTLVQGRDYQLVYEDGADRTMPNTIGFKIQGIGNYEGVLDKGYTFTIKAKELSEKTIRVDNFQSALGYKNGEAVEQANIIVHYIGDGGDVILTPGTDYDISYTENIGPGKAYMNIVGKGIYKGYTVNMSFTIKENMSDNDRVNVRVTKDYLYITPNASGMLTRDFTELDFDLTYNRKDGTEGTNVHLEYGKDYTVDLSKVTTPGKHTIVFKGKGDFAGEKTAEIIVYGNLEKATISGVNATYPYASDTTDVGPSNIIVTYGKDTTGKEYVIDPNQYTIIGDKNRAVGSYTLRINPSSDDAFFQNTLTKNYRICYDLSKATVNLPNGSQYEYVDGGITPTVEVSCNNTALVQGKDYTLRYVNNTSAGEAKVFIEPAADSFAMNSYELPFTIIGKTIESSHVKWKDTSMTGSLVYTGSQLRPAVEVKIGDKTLREGNEYEVVSYTNNVNVGQAKVTVAGKGNYTGTVEKTFNIAEASFATDVDFPSRTPITTYFNKGTAEPDIDVYFHGKKLVQDVDYAVQVTSTSMTADGVMYPTKSTDTASVKITPINTNFKDHKEIPLEILPIDLSRSATVSLVTSSAEYTGEEIEIAYEIECKVNGKPISIVEGEDCEVIFKDNRTVKDVGKYEMQIAAKPDTGFIGSKTLTFTVTPRDLSKHAEVTMEEGYLNNPYNNGSAVTPKVLEVVDKDLGDSGTVLEEGKDYVVSYVNNTKSASGDDPVESKRPAVVIKGKGNYEGTVKKIYFNIGTSIEGATVMLDAPANGYTYDSKPHKPEVTAVVLNGTVLDKKNDYDVTTEGDYINAGENKTVTVEGKGAYYGKALGVYRINPAAADNIRVVLGELNFNEDKKPFSAEYTGKEIEPKVTVYDDNISKGNPLTAETDYTVTFENNVNAGTDTAVAKVTMSDNYSRAVKVATFTILQKDITDDFEIVFDKQKYKYDDREITPEFEVRSKSGQVVSKDDYTVKLSNNRNAGMATIKLEGKNNFHGSVEGQFMIVGALDDPTFTTIKVADQFYTGKQVEPAVSIRCGGNELKQGEDFLVTYVWNETKPYVLINSNPEVPYYTCSEPVKIFYKLAYGKEYLTVAGFANEYTYTGKAIKPAFKVTDLSGKEIENLKFDASDIVYTNLDTGKHDCINVGTIEAKIPVEIEGKEPMELVAEYTIIPKNINDCSITKVNTNTYNGLPIEPAVAIVYNGHELVKKQEFVESYTNNVKPGTATVVLKGVGNYTGQCEQHFLIEPACMIDLTAAPVSETAIRIGWVRNAKVTGYEVYSGDGKTKYGTTKDNYFVVNGLKPATDYTFKVRSYVLDNGVVSYGQPLQVSTYTNVAAVNATVSSVNTGTVTLTWNRTSTVAGYEVYRSTGANDTHKKIATVPNAYSTYTDTRVSSNRTYYYKVRAYKPVNGSYMYGSFSEEMSIRVK